jgi:uncharacterized protein YecT (DUF1311 family)
MRVIYITLILSTLLFWGCQNNQNKDYLSGCSGLDQVDLEMTKLFDQVLEVHKKKKRFIHNMKMAQVAWTQYRNAMSAAYMDKEKRPRDYTQPQKECKCSKMADLTRKRIEELKVFLEPNPDDIMCW